VRFQAMFTNRRGMRRTVLWMTLCCLHGPVVMGQWGSRFEAQNFIQGRWDVAVHEASVGDAGQYGRVSEGKMRVRRMGGSRSVAEFHTSGRDFVLKIAWTSSSDGEVQFRDAPDLSSSVYGSLDDANEEEEEENAGSYSWSNAIPFTFRKTANGISTSQGQILGGGDQFHLNAVSDSQFVLTMTTREGKIFPTWKVYTITAQQEGRSGSSSHAVGSSWISAYSAFLIPITFVISRVVQERQNL